MRQKLLLTFVLALSLFSQGIGQSFYSVRRDHDLIVSVGTGTSTYFGEFKNPGDYLDAKPSINVGAQVFFAPRFIGNRLSARAELTWFYLKGTDATADDDRVERNLNFKSSNWELNTVGLLHVFPQDKKFYKRSFFNMYGFTGVGLMFMNPKTEYEGQKVALQPLQTEGIKYSRFQFVIPYGIGVKFRQSNLYNIAIEAGWRKTFTDYIDDASSVRYPDPSILKSNLSRALSDRRRERDPNYVVKPGVGKRGDPNHMDSYMLLNIKLEYFLPIDLLSNDGRLMWIKRNGPRTR